jgi:hypothetical protein
LYENEIVMKDNRLIKNLKRLKWTYKKTYKG